MCTAHCSNLSHKSTAVCNMYVYIYHNLSPRWSHPPPDPPPSSRRARRTYTYIHCTRSRFWSNSHFVFEHRYNIYYNLIDLRVWRTICSKFARIFLLQIHAREGLSQIKRTERIPGKVMSNWREVKPRLNVKKMYPIFKLCTSSLLYTFSWIFLYHIYILCVCVYTRNNNAISVCYIRLILWRLSKGIFVPRCVYIRTHINRCTIFMSADFID
jgi:hypothetical protein